MGSGERSTSHILEMSAGTVEEKWTQVRLKKRNGSHLAGIIPFVRAKDQRLLIFVSSSLVECEGLRPGRIVEKLLSQNKAAP